MVTGREAHRCSFCGKGEADVRRLVAGPGNVFICDACIALCSDIVAEDLYDVSESAGAQQVLRRCSFCGQRPAQKRRLIAGPGAIAICEECVSLCVEIGSHSQPIGMTRGATRRRLVWPSRWFRLRVTTYTCSFCGKHQNPRRRLVAGPSAVYICSECVDLYNEILTGDGSMQGPKASWGQTGRGWWTRRGWRLPFSRRRLTQ